MADLNRYFPVINPRVSKDQIGLSLVERGKIAIVLTPPMVIEQFESLVETEDLTALYLDIELKSFATRRPIRGE
jgi:hypothetical protein